MHVKFEMMKGSLGRWSVASMSMDHNGVLRPIHT